MEKLIILDYSNQSVHIYDMLPETIVDAAFISKLGFSPSNCHWMYGKYVEITFHKELLQ